MIKTTLFKAARSADLFTAQGIDIPEGWPAPHPTKTDPQTTWWMPCHKGDSKGDFLFKDQEIIIDSDGQAEVKGKRDNNEEITIVFKFQMKIDPYRPIIESDFK